MSAFSAFVHKEEKPYVALSPRSERPVRARSAKMF
jgi:hypothetical protein